MKTAKYYSRIMAKTLAIMLT